ncbi:MAG: type II toxin-antitoxin system RatA family toxin [Pseudomonadota bacterium]
MRSISRTALVTHSAERMFALVDDIETYPEFLPWCAGAEVHSRDNNIVEATLDLQRGQLKRSFRTRNINTPGTSIDIGLVGGPFDHLAGHWQFDPLGDVGSKVSLDMEFEFSNPAVDLMFGGIFESICDSLVDAFVERANSLE